jgi:hypothetical protein
VVTVAFENWLTEKAIKALFDKLEKGPVRIGGLDEQNRELVIWVSQSKTYSGNSSKKDSR